MFLDFMWTFATMEWPAEVSSVSKHRYGIGDVGEWMRWRTDLFEKTTSIRFPLILVKYNFPPVKLKNSLYVKCMFSAIMESVTQINKACHMCHNSSYFSNFVHIVLSPKVLSYWFSRQPSVNSWRLSQLMSNFNNRNHTD